MATLRVMCSSYADLLFTTIPFSAKTKIIRLVGGELEYALCYQEDLVERYIRISRHSGQLMQGEVRSESWPVREYTGPLPKTPEGTAWHRVALNPHYTYPIKSKDARIRVIRLENGELAYVCWIMDDDLRFQHYATTTNANYFACNAELVFVEYPPTI